MKTVREWFNELPEPIRGMALECMWDLTSERKFNTLEDALVSGIENWGKTPQGDEFWDFVCDGKYQDALALIGLPNALLDTAMDNVAKEEYGAIGWFMLTEQQQAYLVKKVALEYHRLSTEK